MFKDREGCESSLAKHTVMHLQSLRDWKAWLVKLGGGLSISVATLDLAALMLLNRIG